MISRRRFLAGAGALLVGAAAVWKQAQASAESGLGRVLGHGSPNASGTPEPERGAGPAAAPGQGANRIWLENQLPGGAGWELGGDSTPAVEGYAGQRSFVAGDRLTLHAAGDGPIDVEWWRLGWYHGTGGRLVRVDRNVSVPARGAIVGPDPDTGLVEARWPAVCEFEIGADWPTGMYVAVLRSASHRDGYAPFVVRESTLDTVAPVLFVSAATTWQAYNSWGGKSLYGYNSTGFTTAVRDPRAAIVSFDRPFELDSGAGYLRRWELQFIRWQERHGRDVAYAADIDLALHPEAFGGRRLIVFAGHHEYWSRTMRETIEGAVANGTNVAFLSANEVYWQVRLADGPLGAASRVVCYKSAPDDPLTASQPALATCRWREEPVAAPEAALVGQMYGHIVEESGDWVVTNPGHWIYAGTNVVEGDHFVNLVGQEYDTLFPDLVPADIEVIARGPVDPMISDDHDPGAYSSPAVHTATVHRASSGATIVAAGTFQWSWAIDGYGNRAYHGRLTPTDWRVGRMTANIFDRLGDGPPPEA